MKAIFGVLLLLALVACGGGGDSPSGPSVSPTNVAPVANAGVTQNVLAGTTVTLDGSASDANGDPLTFSWSLSSKPTGSTASLSSSTSAKPTFDADIAGTYVATLLVNDGKVSSAPVNASITATISNAAPVANAGVAQNVVVGTVVTLDGSASSDANSDPLTNAWSLTTKPSGSTATLSSTSSVKPTFNADIAGIYVASLTVNDGKVNSTAATVSITATVANAAPVANAGVAQTVVVGNLVTLNGAASSDANGDALTYTWTLTSKPAGSTALLSNPTSAKPTFTADVAGTYLASLTVNDGKVSSAAATIAVSASPTHGTGTSKNYSISATRMAQDFYSMSASSTILHTRFCYEFASSDSAILKMTGSTGNLDGSILFSNGASCDVAGAYGPIFLSGSYAAMLTVETLPFYSDLATKSLFRADASCLAYEYYSDSVLNFNAGTILFGSGATCTLIGAYGLLRLN